MAVSIRLAFYSFSPLLISWQNVFFTRLSWNEIWGWGRRFCFHVAHFQVCLTKIFKGNREVKTWTQTDAQREKCRRFTPKGLFLGSLNRSLRKNIQIDFDWGFPLCQILLTPDFPFRSLKKRLMADIVDSWRRARSAVSSYSFSPISHIPTLKKASFQNRVIENGSPKTLAH